MTEELTKEHTMQEVRNVIMSEVDEKTIFIVKRIILEWNQEATFYKLKLLKKKWCKK